MAVETRAVETRAVETHVFRCLSDNVGILVHDPAGGATAAIDVPDAAAVRTALAERGWRLTDILVTHGHSDHVQGVAELARETGARVVLPRETPEIVGGETRVGEGDRVRVGTLEAEVWDAPGHADDHVVYHFAGEKLVLPGDVLFPMGCGRVFSGDYDTFHRALERLAALPEDTLAHCGHDYTLANAEFASRADPDNPALARRLAEARAAKSEGRLFGSTTIGEERATNPFLRAGEPALAASVGQDGAPASAVFRALREWKNRG
ncbi:hydroxyacylglutathione hydrolase [Salinarimonas sp.]|uniref:hydroxyacylglutathione hydrolase n=1 Tax=Salinarimonas sp. TaxID=2766526 RepID=UPI00391AA124